MRVLGIDYGERRIGVAVSDPTGTFATPLPTLTRRRGKRPPMGALRTLARDHDAIALVVGLPLAADGTETEWCAAVRRFGDRLGSGLALDVYYVDERMTSARAERVVRSLALPRRKREQKERVDAAAAALILQRWLDTGGKIASSD